MDKSKLFVFGGKDKNDNEIEANLIRLELSQEGIQLKILTINQGAKILGITFHGSAKTDYTFNFNKIHKKITKSVNFHNLRKMLIKGRALILNGEIYTKLWHTAHVLPLSKQDLEPIWQNEQDFLKKFKKLGQNFIWKGNPQIPNKETTCPIRQGGLNIVDVGYKALTLL